MWLARLLACPVIAFPLILCAQAPLQLRGRVLDAATREPIAKALVTVRGHETQTTTNDDGEFMIPGLPAGKFELYVSTVGYGLLKEDIEFPGTGGPLEILLGQEAFRRTDTVTVSADIFETADGNNASEHTLNNTELKNLANVLVDDPLRSVQTLPGVTTGDDFYAQFSVRGSGFRNIGFYIDGVLAKEPFHTVRDVNDSGSLTILNGDLVESLSLYSGGAPARYGDRTAAALNVETRNGNTERIVGRANLAATGASFTAEGPIGKLRKLSWVAAARKSYADWLIQKLSDNPNTAVALGFTDGQGNLSYAPSIHHRFTVSTLLGSSRANRERERNTLGTNSFLTGDMETAIANIRWQWVQSRLVSRTGVHVSTTNAENRNAGGEQLYNSQAQDIGFRNDTSYPLSTNQQVNVGVFVRHLYEESQRRLFSSGTGFAISSGYNASAWQPGFYAETTWKVRDGIAITAGGRFDSFSATEERVLLPRIGASYTISRTTITASYGQYSQFPGFEDLHGEFGVTSLHSQRSRHGIVAIEQRITEKTRIRAEFYDKRETSLIFSAETEPRIVGGHVVRPQSGPVLRNTLSGYSRGVELYVQRRSANRLSGWVSYALGFSRFRDSSTQLAFDGDFDQRHTVNLYGSYRFTKALNLSAKFRYGSNFPAVGFYVFNGGKLFLSDKRNLTRLPAYSRLDVRANYAFHFDRWKLTLYTEVTNALARDNIRFTDLDRFNLAGQVFYGRESLLPFLPSAGIGIEF